MTKMNLKNERWCIIKEFPNYAISSLGRVRSMRTGKLLKRQYGGSKRKTYAYPYVDLRYNGRRRCPTIHVLVAEAFLGLRPDGCVIHHKDRNRKNPRLENLEYITTMEHKQKHDKLKKREQK